MMVVEHQGESRLDVAVLLGALDVEAEVISGGKEGRAGRVHVEAGDVDDGLLTHLAQVGSILVGVGGKATC